ncbi:hypothetical protein EV401DRAFT_893495 [Pisolithus croceorrhizus]|nr:hypothetical protein EV401DRAFT_893495 [Pisolithus croceorrhizus]
MQGHASEYIMDRDTTLLPSYTNPLQFYVIGQTSGYPHESGDVSVFGDLDNSSAGPTVDLGPITSLRDRISGQEPHPSNYFTCGNIPLLPEQTRTGLVILPQSLSSFTPQPTEQIRPQAPFHYEYPIASQSSSTPDSTSDSSISSSPSFPMPNQSSSSWSPPEHLGYPLPVHPHYARPVGLPGFHGFNTGSKTELHASGALDDHAAHVLGDHPSRTLSDRTTCLFCSHATHIPDDHTTSGEVDNYGNFNESKFNSEQVVGLPPQLSPAPNQLPLSPHRLPHVSRIKYRGLPGTFYYGHRFAIAQPRTQMKLPKTRSVCDRSTFYSCGWRDDKGRRCGMPISCEDCTGHFAASHGIRNIAWNVKVTCCWCPAEPQKMIVRKNFLRHMKEVHLCHPRSGARI